MPQLSSTCGVRRECEAFGSPLVSAPYRLSAVLGVWGGSKLVRSVKSLTFLLRGEGPGYTQVVESLLEEAGLVALEGLRRRVFRVPFFQRACM